MLIKQFAKYSRQINKMWQSFLPKQPLLFHWSVPSSQAVRLQLFSVKREFCSTVTGMHAEPNITVCSTHRFHWCCKNLGRNHVGYLRYICVGVSNCFWWRKRFFLKNNHVQPSRGALYVHSCYERHQHYIQKWRWNTSYISYLPPI